MAVVGEEEQRTVCRRQRRRFRILGSGVEIGDQVRAGSASVAHPQLDAVYAVVGAEVDAARTGGELLRGVRTVAAPERSNRAHQGGAGGVPSLRQTAQPPGPSRLMNHKALPTAVRFSTFSS
jgi:hypothetical protein